jgi:hypothetical protein
MEHSYFERDERELLSIIRCLRLAHPATAAGKMLKAFSLSVRLYRLDRAENSAGRVLSSWEEI